MLMNLKQFLFVTIVGMNHLNGWGNARVAMSGIHFLKKRYLILQEFPAFFQLLNKQKLQFEVNIMYNLK